jgi:hypothetical protein
METMAMAMEALELDINDPKAVTIYEQEDDMTESDRGERGYTSEILFMLHYQPP